MPSSCSKALSSVALAEIWAEMDPDAAVWWIRDNLTGPVFQDALIAAAAASGSDNPARALDLFRAWIELDPPAARHWIDPQPEGALRQSAEAGMKRTKDPP
jgi:hypothetical protein